MGTVIQGSGSREEGVVSRALVLVVQVVGCEIWGLWFRVYRQLFARLCVDDLCREGVKSLSFSHALSLCLSDMLTMKG